MNWLKMLLYLHWVVVLFKDVELVLYRWTTRRRQDIVIDCLNVVFNNEAATA